MASIAALLLSACKAYAKFCGDHEAFARAAAHGEQIDTRDKNYQTGLIPWNSVLDSSLAL